ncbi:uncharacterized protein TNCV_2358461 [Trichonephila clavipes]|nr:uncharacterized protein TNCV_2358461 [Trichonephila clavipes]
MGTRLRKLKLVYSKKKLSDGKTIGGKGRLTDSLIDKLAHYYGNAIRCNSTSVKEMRKAIWAVWGHSCSTDDYRCTRFVLQIQIHGKFCPRTIGSSLQIAEIAENLATSVFNDGNQILITILEKFGFKINRNVSVSLAERDNCRIFTSRQSRLESSFEARRAKKIKKSQEIGLFQKQEATPGRKRLRSVQGGVVHKIIQGNRPLEKSFELSSSAEEYRMFSEHQTGRYAPDLWTGRRRCMISRKTFSR